MMGDQVEHQAMVVEKGLKMKIKRKNASIVSTVTTVSSKLPADNKFASPGVTDSEKPEVKKSKSDDGVNSDSEDGERSASSTSSLDDKVAKKMNKNVTAMVTNRVSTMPKSNSISKCSKNTPNGGQALIDDDAKRKSKKGKEEGDGDMVVAEEETTEDGEDKMSAAVSIGNSTIADDPYEFVAKNEDLIKTTTPKKRGKMERTHGDSNMKKLNNANNESFLNTSPGNSSVSCNTATETNSIAVTTDMDLLGPCEPGTSVILEGIVWSESNNGILVVNVTWRGKTYVGTLMDATKHHWASPRYRDESPLLDAKTKRNGQSMEPVPEGRRLRKCRRNNISANSSSNNIPIATNNGGNINSSCRAQPQMRHSPLSIQTMTDNRRRPRPSECESPAPAPKKILREPIVAMVPADQVATNTEATMFECRLVPDCGKKFKHAAGLRYHQSHAHKKVLQAAEFADLKAAEEKTKKKKVPTATLR